MDDRNALMQVIKGEIRDLSDSSLECRRLLRKEEHGDIRDRIDIQLMAIEEKQLKLSKLIYSQWSRSLQELEREYRLIKDE